MERQLIIRNDCGSGAFLMQKTEGTDDDLVPSII